MKTHDKIEYTKLTEGEFNDLRKSSFYGYVSKQGFNFNKGFLSCLIGIIFKTEKGYIFIKANDLYERSLATFDEMFGLFISKELKKILGKLI